MKFFLYLVLKSALTKVYQMNVNKLDRFEIENIEDCLPLFEKTFNIQLENTEIQKLNSFEEFCDLIVSKFKSYNNDLCTSQRAFYQFRKALEIVNIANSINITPDTDLKNVFTKKNRKKNIKKIEKQLGYKLDVLQPSQITINVLCFIFLLSIIGLFFLAKIAIFGLFISVAFFYLTKFTNRLSKKTIKELIEKTTAQNYFQIRNTQKSINKFEFKAIILEWFSENTGIKKEKLKHGTFV